MLLRESGRKEAQDYLLDSVTSTDGDSGVRHSAHLRALTEAAISGDWLSLSDLRTQAEKEMSKQQVVDVLVVAAAFNGITRVADATGIPLDENTREQTVEMREDTGIDSFAYAQKSARYDF